jgi:hypothetical protein
MLEAKVTGVCSILDTFGTAFHSRLLSNNGSNYLSRAFENYLRMLFNPCPTQLFRYATQG